MRRRIVTVAVGVIALVAGGCSTPPDQQSSTPSPSFGTPSAAHGPATAPPVPAGTESFDVVRVEYLDSDDADPAENWADLYLPAGAREQTPIATRDIKRLASRWRAKCPDHPGRPADRCYECGLEIANGDRPADKMGVARPPMKNLESNRGRIRALLGGES